MVGTLAVHVEVTPYNPNAFTIGVTLCARFWKEEQQTMTTIQYGLLLLLQLKHGFYQFYYFIMNRFFSFILLVNFFNREIFKEYITRLIETTS